VPKYAVQGEQVTRFTVQHVAKLAGCDKRTVRKLCDLGLLPHSKDYNQWRISAKPDQVAVQVQQLLGVEALDAAGRRAHLAKQRRYLEELCLERDELTHLIRRGVPEADRGAAEEIMAGLNKSLREVDLKIKQLELETECCKHFEKTGTEKDDG